MEKQLQLLMERNRKLQRALETLAAESSNGRYYSAFEKSEDVTDIVGELLDDLDIIENKDSP